jgi:hypothetical protein
MVFSRTTNPADTDATKIAAMFLCPHALAAAGQRGNSFALAGRCTH